MMTNRGLFKPFLLFSSCFFSGLSPSTHADTIVRYMNIAENIPKMEMKADPQSQAWARSARNILILTSESIAETLYLANEIATQKGQPLFCPPAGETITAEQMNDLIQQTYRSTSGLQADKDKMSVSEVALQGLSAKYRCNPFKAQGFKPNSQPPSNGSASRDNPFNSRAQMAHQSANY